MALATVADYEAITGTTVPASPSPVRARIERLLDLCSSAALAGAHGQNITETTYTAVSLNVHDGLAYFPQRPVSQVTTVTIDGVTLVDGTDYRWTPGGNRAPAVLVRVDSGCDSVWTGKPVATFTAGWNPVPGQVIAMVVSMVRSTIVNEGAQPSTQEGAGPFQESWEGVETENANLSLTVSAQATLDRLCGLRSAGSSAIGRDQP